MYREGASPLIKRENYSAPAFWIDTVELTFDLDPQKILTLLSRHSDWTGKT